MNLAYSSAEAYRELIDRAQSLIEARLEKLYEIEERKRAHEYPNRCELQELAQKIRPLETWLEDLNEARHVEICELAVKSITAA